MAKLFITIIPYLVVFSHALLLLVFVAVLTRKFWGKGIYIFIGKNVLLLGFLITLGAMVGSLFYSEIIGYEACVLCWWQRIFLYPQMFIFALALYRKDRSIFPYITSLTLLALLVALYQTYYDFGGKSLLTCTSEGGSCSKIYVKEFGYITIPIMSLTVSLYILLLAWVHKLFRTNN